jgi:hypothetical protein
VPASARPNFDAKESPAVGIPNIGDADPLGAAVPASWIGRVSIISSAVSVADTEQGA